MQDGWINVPSTHLISHKVKPKYQLYKYTWRLETRRECWDSSTEKWKLCILWEHEPTDIARKVEPSPLPSEEGVLPWEQRWNSPRRCYQFRLWQFLLLGRLHSILALEKAAWCSGKSSGCSSLELSWVTYWLNLGCVRGSENLVCYCPWNLIDAPSLWFSNSSHGSQLGSVEWLIETCWECYIWGQVWSCKWEQRALFTKVRTFRKPLRCEALFITCDTA